MLSTTYEAGTLREVILFTDSDKTSTEGIVCSMEMSSSSCPHKLRLRTS